MKGSKSSVLFAASTALAVLSAASAGWAAQHARHGLLHHAQYPGGTVQRCSLEGVNPAHHPHIFGSATSAAAYGFVQSADGNWHVSQRLCR